MNFKKVKCWWCFLWTLLKRIPRGSNYFDTYFWWKILELILVLHPFQPMPDPASLRHVITRSSVALAISFSLGKALKLYQIDVSFSKIMCFWPLDNFSSPPICSNEAFPSLNTNSTSYWKVGMWKGPDSHLLRRSGDDTSEILSRGTFVTEIWRYFNQI